MCDNVNCSVFESRQAREVIELFSKVFSDSEGRDEGETIGSLVAELITTPTRDLFGFVAADHGKIVASIFFSRLRFREPVNAFLLSPVAVDTSQQGKGIGQKLIRFGLDRLEADGVHLAFTYGDPNFYRKVGFEPVSEDVIKAPLPLTYPEGWLGQSLTDEKLKPIAGGSQCVEALNKPELW